MQIIFALAGIGFVIYLGSMLGFLIDQKKKQ